MYRSAAITWGPNKSKADRATRSIFNLLDRKPAIDNLSTGGITPQAPMSGTIEFKNVSFKYPSRPDAPVLRDVSITIKMGQKVGVRLLLLCALLSCARICNKKWGHSCWVCVHCYPQCETCAQRY